MSILKIILILFTCLLGIIMEMSKDFKNSELRNFFKWVFVFSSFILMVLTLFTYFQENEESTSRFTTTINKADRTLENIYIISDSLSKIQHTANIIVDSLKKQLDKQNEQIVITQLLNEKSEKQYQSQKITLSNTEQLLNPIFPLDIYIHILISLEDAQYADLKSSILKIRDSFRTNSQYKPSDIYYQKGQSGTDTVEALRFKDFDARFLNLRNSKDALVTDRNFYISFLTDNEMVYLKEKIESANTDFSSTYYLGNNHLSFYTIFDKVFSTESLGIVYMNDMKLSLHLKYENYQPKNIFPFLNKFTLQVSDLQNYNLLLVPNGTNKYELLHLNLTPKKLFGKGFEMKPSKSRVLPQGVFKWKVYYGKIQDFRDEGMTY